MNPIKPQITFDDFLRTDLRIGTVVSADYILEQKQLLKLGLDFGFDCIGTIVAPIGDSFTPNAVMGRQLLCVINVPPKEICGVMSVGIVLTARRSDGVLALCELTGQVAAGSELEIFRMCSLK